MSDAMGTFRTDVELENPAARGARQRVSGVLVDTGAELSCFPAPVLEALGVARQKSLRFRQADGLEGLNRRVDPVTKSLVDAGPVSLAAVGGGHASKLIRCRGPHGAALASVCSGTEANDAIRALTWSEHDRHGHLQDPDRHRGAGSAG